VTRILLHSAYAINAEEWQQTQTEAAIVALGVTGRHAGDSRVLILKLLPLGSLMSIILACAIWKWSQRRLIPTNLDAFAPELDEP